MAPSLAQLFKGSQTGGKGSQDQDLDLTPTITISEKSYSLSQVLNFFLCEVGIWREPSSTHDL